MKWGEAEKWGGQTPHPTSLFIERWGGDAIWLSWIPEGSEIARRERGIRDRGLCFISRLDHIIRMPNAYEHTRNEA